MNSFAVTMCLASLALLFVSVWGASAEAQRRPGDPPRIAARDLYEYRHLQLFNPEYVKWVRDNIHEIEYERHPAVVSEKWNTLKEQIEMNVPVVVMVTQTTVSRLPALRLAMREWGGPVSASVYIEFQPGTGAADRCETQVIDYMHATINELWQDADDAPPVSISILFSAFDIPGASCDVPGTASSGGTATVSGSRAGRNTSSDTVYNVPGVPRHTIKRFQRTLLQSQDSMTFDDPGGGPAVRPLWHFHPKSKGFMLNVAERPWKQVYAEFYPVNTLRNLAWDQVPSGVFVFLNDIDFLPTPTLHADLTSGKWRSELQRMRSVFVDTRQRETLVLPAFERLATPGADGGPPTAVPWEKPCHKSNGCEIVQDMALPRSFEMLRTMLQEETVVDIFHRTSFVLGHGCYSWMTWLQAKNPVSMVPMDYAHPCEPYVIALSDALPRYDERFRGRGQNKVEQLTHMAMWGFKWRLLPGHFVIHVPHPSTDKPEGGWDIPTTPLALLKSKMLEIEREPEFKRHVVQSVPLPVQA